MLPASDVSNVIAAKDDLLTVKTELQNIVDSGPLGDALFGKSITLFAHEAIDTFIDLHIARRFASGMPLFDDAEQDFLVAEITEEVQAHKQFQYILKKRAVRYGCCGRDFKRQVISWNDAINLIGMEDRSDGS